VLEASEQSRRAAPPEISAPVKLREALAFRAALRIVLSESEDRTMLKDVLKNDASSGVAMAIGPEGGWTHEELRSLQEAGWISASLGQTILRAETAAIAATAIVSAALTHL
jgi:16S rRNA (uracil1498-N3)-methyltransferase